MEAPSGTTPLHGGRDSQGRRWGLSEQDTREEIELVLMIVSSDPQGMARKVVLLDSIAGYRLTRQPPLAIHDVYFDTADGQLKGRRVNLRVRHQDDGYWLTMKKSPGALAWRRIERQELEIPWSQSSMNRVQQEFARQGIKLMIPASTAESDPVKTLKSLGLLVTQDRETRREASNLLEEREGEGPLAELAVDSVRYKLSTATVGLCEVEIEAKSREGRAVLKEVRSALLRRFGDELRPWKHGKLVTGKAVKRLMDRGELQGLLVDGYLMPEAFERIDLEASQRRD